MRFRKHLKTNVRLLLFPLGMGSLEGFRQQG